MATTESTSMKQKAIPQDGARTLNTYGSNLWVDDGSKRRKAATGRGLFSGLKGQKRYSVQQGWAKRTNELDPHQQSLLAGLWESFWGSGSNRT